MDILLLMLLIWGYNEQPKDAKEEQPVIVPVQEVEVPDNAVDVVAVTQTAAVLTAVAEAMTSTILSTVQILVQILALIQVQKLIVQVLQLQNRLSLTN